MTTRTLPLPGLGPARRSSDRRPTRATAPRNSGGASLVGLVEVALLGWFGLMLLVTALTL